MSIRRGSHIVLPGGDGSHVVQLLYWGDDSEPYGLADRHRNTTGDGFHGGYLAWRDPSGGTGEIKVQHTLINKDPVHLTIHPSLACAFVREGEPCQSHGWIRDGRWIDAAAPGGQAVGES
jgi:hypothetical protein